MKTFKQAKGFGLGLLSHTPSAKLTPPEDWGHVTRADQHRPRNPSLLGLCKSPPPTHPLHSSVLFRRKLRRTLQTHRQAELQVLLRHEQQIPVKGTRRRHCSCPPCACAARARSHLFLSPKTETEPEGPEAEARRGRRYLDVSRAPSPKPRPCGRGFLICECLVVGGLPALVAGAWTCVVFWSGV